MVWIYFSSSFTKIDKSIVDYIEKKNVRILHHHPDDFDNIIKEYNGRITNVILSNLNDSAEIINDYIYIPLCMKYKCRTQQIHFTLLQYAGFRYDHLYMLDTDILYLKFSTTIIDDDINKNNNSLYNIIYNDENKIHYYYLSVLYDLLPILFDIISKKKQQMYYMINPTTISLPALTNLYKEYIDKEFVEEGNISYDIEYNLEWDNEIGTIKKDYFILPIYQSIQRLFKRIRKSSIYDIKIDLHTTRSNVLITGGYGFIGSNFIHYLYYNYPKTNIVNIDRLDYCSRKEHLQDFEKSERVTSYVLDLSETNQIYDILVKHKIDYVYHFAAQSHVDNSFNNSLQFSKDNVYCTHSLLEACKNYGKILRFIHVSTDEIYGETLQLTPFKEIDMPNPTNPYAATKVGAEFIVKSYYHCFELPIIIIRGNNVFGPRQYPEKMIPKFIQLLIQNEKCTIAGNGLMQRNYIYVNDLCEALVTVLEKGIIDNIYNIGNHEEKSVLDIAKILIREIKSTHDFRDHIQYVKDRYYNDFRYSIDISKICNLGWQPRSSLENGIRTTIQYYQENNQIFS